MHDRAMQDLTIKYISSIEVASIIELENQALLGNKYKVNVHLKKANLWCKYRRGCLCCRRFAGV